MFSNNASALNSAKIYRRRASEVQLNVSNLPDKPQPKNFVEMGKLLAFTFN